MIEAFKQNSFDNSKYDLFNNELKTFGLSICEIAFYQQKIKYDLNYGFKKYVYIYIYVYIFMYISKSQIKVIS